jgi:hypothetical protein
MVHNKATVTDFVMNLAQCQQLKIQQKDVWKEEKKRESVDIYQRLHRLW